MRTREFRKDGQTIIFKQLNCADLYNDKIFKKPRKLYPIFKVRDEKKARALAANMLIDMLHMILDDMIKDYTKFLFPLPNFGTMRILDITDRVNPDVYKFDPATHGKVYGLYILNTPHSKENLNDFYFVRLWHHVYDKIRDYVSKSGSGYPKPPS